MGNIIYFGSACMISLKRVFTKFCIQITIYKYVFCFKDTFMWDKSLEVVNYSNWAPGEPNDGKNESIAGGNGEDCVAIGRRNGTWEDLPCDCRIAYALCEPNVECSNNLYTVVGIGIVEFVLLLIFVVCFFIRRRQDNLDRNKEVNGYTRDSYYGRQESY